jgi:hypothetical protein
LYPSVVVTVVSVQVRPQRHNRTFAATAPLAATGAVAAALTLWTATAAAGACAGACAGALAAALVGVMMTLGLLVRDPSTASEVPSAGVVSAASVATSAGAGATEVSGSSISVVAYTMDCTHTQSHTQGQRR